MSTEHGLAGMVGLAVLLLALAGAIRWDLLCLWWRDLLTAPAPLTAPPPLEQRLSQAQHHRNLMGTGGPVQHGKPAFHRSGRRG